MVFMLTSSSLYVLSLSMQKYLKWFTEQKHFFLFIKNKLLDLKHVHITLWKWILELCDDVAVQAVVFLQEVLC